MKNNIVCNLCGASHHSIVYKNSASEDSAKSYKISEPEPEKPERVLRCNSCGLMFAEQTKCLEYYTDKYVKMFDEEYIGEGKGRRLSSVKILGKIERCKKKGELLDVGCANGFFLDEARRKGWKVRGLEISKWAAEYARQKLGLDVINGDVRNASLPDKHFDVVVMLDVIEHLPDPKHVLLEIRRILKDDGILYVSTPDINSILSKILKARWWGINKYHLYYFSKNTFEKMLNSCGFEVKKYYPHTRIFSLWYWALRTKVHSKLLYCILDFISRIGNLGSKLLIINFGDQIEVAVAKARKLDYLADPASNKISGTDIPISYKI